MNVTLYGRTFKFHKVVQQQNSCGGRLYFTVFRSLSTNPKVKELLKSVHICQSYRKNKSGTFFNGPRCIMRLKIYVIYIISENVYNVLVFFLSRSYSNCYEEINKQVENTISLISVIVVIENVVIVFARLLVTLVHGRPMFIVFFD